MFNYSVYCHIPFCKKKCPYCCITAKYENSEFTNLSLMDTYVDALVKDIYATEFPEGTIESIVFGGGTPSLLSSEQLEKIMNALKDKISPERFDKIKVLTYEISPDTATQEKLDAFRKNGFNRLSFGIQSFIESELKLLARPYTKNMILNSLERVKKSGYKSMNVDLLIGITGQTFESIMYSVKEAVSLKIENISINIFYSLYKGGNEFLTKCNSKNKNIETMNIEEKKHVYGEICKFLVSEGYNRVDNTVFSLPNTMATDNSYVDKDTDYPLTDSMLAFGPGSSGFLGKSVRYTPPSISNYIKNPQAVYEKITAKKYGFAILWINLITHKRIKEDNVIDYFGMGFDELRNSNKYINNIFSNLIKENVANFKDRTFTLDPNSLDKATILMQYIRGGDGFN